MNLAQLIERHEGRSPFMYKDTLGFETIAVGFLVDRRRSPGLPPHIIDALRDWSIAGAEEELHKALPWTLKLDPVRHAVLVDMTFNLGIEPFDHDGFKDWPIFVGQVQRGEYEAAKKNMLSTLWAKQVGHRAVEDAEMLVTGEWPK